MGVATTGERSKVYCTEGEGGGGYEVKSGP